MPASLNSVSVRGQLTVCGAPGPNGGYAWSIRDEPPNNDTGCLRQLGLEKFASPSEDGTRQIKGKSTGRHGYPSAPQTHVEKTPFDIVSASSDSGFVLLADAENAAEKLCDALCLDRSSDLLPRLDHDKHLGAHRLFYMSGDLTVEGCERGAVSEMKVVINVVLCAGTEVEVVLALRKKGLATYTFRETSWTAELLQLATDQGFASVAADVKYASALPKLSDSAIAAGRRVRLPLRTCLWGLPKKPRGAPAGSTENEAQGPAGE